MIQDTRNRSAGIAIVVASLAGLVTMALHPNGADAIGNATTGGHNVLAIAVHALAIAAIPVLVSGMLVLTVRLARISDVAWVAFVTYAIAAVSILVAATASGLISPALLANYETADEPTRAIIRSQLHFAGEINQAFAKVFVMLSAAAIALWSLVMRRSAEFGVRLVTLGFVIAALLSVGVASGHLTLNVHGFGAVAVAEAIWMCWSALTLMRLPRE